MVKSIATNDDALNGYRRLRLYINFTAYGQFYVFTLYEEAPNETNRSEEHGTSHGCAGCLQGFLRFFLSFGTLNRREGRTI